jgi:hypothetical protein
LIEYGDRPHAFLRNSQPFKLVAPEAGRELKIVASIPFAQGKVASYSLVAMSTLVEIQDAVVRLSSDERKALQLWLNSQSEPILTPREEERLLRSLDDAASDIDSGKGLSLNDVRKRVASWAAK